MPNHKERIDRILRRWLPALLSGVLLAAAFPPMENWEVAWVALIPLLLLALSAAPGEAFRWGWLSGLCFWLLSLSWLLRLCVTGAPWALIVPGWIAMAAYCALYTGAFCAALAWLAGRIQSPGARAGTGTQLVLLIAAPVLWVGGEYWRSVLLTGFPWNALGISQFGNLAVIQVASWGGVGAVSAVVVVMNAALALVARDLFRTAERRRRFRPELMAGLLLCVSVWIGGTRSVRETVGEVSTWPTLRVAAIQPGIPQQKKWSEAAISFIYESLERQTSLAQLAAPDLIVWPETAVPGVLSFDKDAEAFARAQARAGTPLLFGALDADRDPRGDRFVYWNASFLLDGEGAIRERYRKIHLVPFGEYLPFDRLLPFLQRLSPLGISCVPGKDFTVFHLPGAKKTPFAALICFEDVFPDLSRRFVAEGAALLVNQTNDAWFDGSAGARQHMSHAVFRGVENRVTMVRATNTGITSQIDPTGRVNILDTGGGVGAVAGFAVYGAALRPSGQARTVYGRYGDLVFSLPCGILLLVVLAAAGLPGLATRMRERGRSPGKPYPSSFTELPRCNQS